MNKQARSRKFNAKRSARLGAYVAAGLGASTAATPITDAAIVDINIGPSGFNIGGINAGKSTNTFFDITNFPTTGAGRLRIYAGYESKFGFSGVLNLRFATNGGYASPKKFAENDLISSNSSFNSSIFNTAFQFADYSQPDWGPGSYLGFRTAQTNYGWLQVTWNNAADQFEIISGAYESVSRVGILAGQSAAPAAVPEPGGWAAAALLAGGATYVRWRRRRNGVPKKAA